MSPPLGATRRTSWLPLLLLLVVALSLQLELSGAPHLVGVQQKPVRLQSADPSTVGTSTTPLATASPNQRKTFYANGRFWAFYGDGTNLAYSSSLDGNAWNPIIPIRAGNPGNQFSIWFDGTYLSYVAFDSSTGILAYRKGDPLMSGGISWLTSSEQTAVTNTGVVYFSPTISLDSAAHPWLAYVVVSSSYFFRVTTSSTTNGPWTTSSGFPMSPIGTNTLGSYGAVQIVPLSGGKMLALYAVTGGAVKTSAWTGSSWTCCPETATPIKFAAYFSAVAQGDDVHLVFLRDSSQDVVYTKYSYSSNSFGPEVVLQSIAAFDSAPVISINPATDDLYVFWAGSPSANHIYYKKFTASTGLWDSTPTDWITELGTVSNDQLSSFYQSNNGYIGVEYTRNYQNQLQVRFAFIPCSPPVTVTETTTLTSPTTLTVTATYTATGTVTTTATYTTTGTTTETLTSTYSSVGTTTETTTASVTSPTTVTTTETTTATTTSLATTTETTTSAYTTTGSVTETMTTTSTAPPMTTTITQSTAITYTSTGTTTETTTAITTSLGTSTETTTAITTSQGTTTETTTSAYTTTGTTTQTTTSTYTSTNTLTQTISYTASGTVTVTTTYTTGSTTCFAGLPCPTTTFTETTNKTTTTSRTPGQSSPIPGFPAESIVAGLSIALLALMIKRRRK